MTHATPRLLCGAHRIAAYLGEPWTPRRVQIAAASGDLPIFKLRGAFCARPERLDEEFTRREAEAMQRADEAAV